MDAAGIADLIERRAEIESVRCRVLAASLELYPFREKDAATVAELDSLYAQSTRLKAMTDGEMQDWIAGMCEGGVADGG